MSCRSAHAPLATRTVCRRACGMEEARRAAPPASTSPATQKRPAVKPKSKCARMTRNAGWGRGRQPGSERRRTIPSLTVSFPCEDDTGRHVRMQLPRNAQKRGSELRAGAQTAFKRWRMLAVTCFRIGEPGPSPCIILCNLAFSPKSTCSCVGLHKGVASSSGL